MTHSSFPALLRNALSGHRNWPEQWPDAEPKAGAAKGWAYQAQKATHHGIECKRYRIHDWTIA